MPLASADEILPASEMPSLSAVYMLDAVIGNIQVALDNHFTKCMVTALLKLCWYTHQSALVRTTLLVLENVRQVLYCADLIDQCI